MEQQAPKTLEQQLKEKEKQIDHSRKCLEKVLSKHGLKYEDLSKRDRILILVGYDLCIEVS